MIGSLIRDTCQDLQHPIRSKFHYRFDMLITTSSNMVISRTQNRRFPVDDKDVATASMISHATIA